MKSLLFKCSITAPNFAIWEPMGNIFHSKYCISFEISHKLKGISACEKYPNFKILLYFFKN